MKIAEDKTITITEEGKFTCDVYLNGEHEWDIATTDGELRIEMKTSKVIEDG